VIEGDPTNLDCDQSREKWSNQIWVVEEAEVDEVEEVVSRTRDLIRRSCNGCANELRKSKAAATKNDRFAILARHFTLINLIVIRLLNHLQSSNASVTLDAPIFHKQ
jgi:hypothetical protein